MQEDFHRLFDMSLEEAKEQFGDKNFESYDEWDL